MAWIESHEEIGGHPKTEKLALLLGVRVPEAVGLLHLLWHLTLKQSWRDGDLKRFSFDSISSSCRWKGDPKRFIKALRNAGFLDGLKVHDWSDFAGRLIRDRLRYERANKTHEIRTEPRRNPAVTPPSSVANQTLPNLTLPNQTKRRGGENGRPPADFSLWLKKVNGMPEGERLQNKDQYIGELTRFNLPFAYQDELIAKFFGKNGIEPHQNKKPLEGPYG